MSAYTPLILNYYFMGNLRFAKFYYVEVEEEIIVDSVYKPENFYK